jgi:hypothetical protein
MATPDATDRPDLLPIPPSLAPTPPPDDDTDDLDPDEPDHWVDCETVFRAETDRLHADAALLHSLSFYLNPGSEWGEKTAITFPEKTEQALYRAIHIVLDDIELISSRPTLLGRKGDD